MRLKIKKQDYYGMGIADNNGKISFVKKALSNEEVEVKLINNQKHYDIYQVTKIIKENKKRKVSYCPYSKECAGCMLDILSYEDALKIKEKGIKELFSKNNINIDDFYLEKNEQPLNYRNKISLKVHNYHLGYYEEYSHQFIKIDKCLIAKETIINLMQDFSWLKFKEGELTIRVNEREELLIIIKTKNEVKFNEKLYEKYKIAGIIINNVCYYLEPFFYIRQDKCLYKVSYDAFFQVNFNVSQKISADILKFINNEDKILDLYCGVGYFTIKMAKKSQEVTGIEIVKNAILDANKNAKLNNIKNVNFHLGKVENILPKIKKKFTKVLIDPPRNGLDKKTINILLFEEIPTIIYVSCNPNTLLRDLKLLLTKYKIEFIKGYDMFSYTKHVECLCVLKLK